MTQSDWIGKTLSQRYDIQELVGRGGMSAVYKATDPNLKRVVAIKLIHGHLSADPDFVRRFEDEAASVAQLRHPNIIQVYDFNNDGDTYYIVFEFIPGESLQGRLKRMEVAGRSMAVSEVVDIGANISDALDYAHQRGLVHRDIKPANVMLNVHGQAILMDFGIVKIMGGDSHTATGAAVGTARYMSPEQIRGQHVDARTDIYSMGIMLFEMVGGRPPYEADSALTLMMMHVNDPVPDLLAMRPELPKDLVLTINRALAKDPAQRFQSAGELAVALRAANLDAPTVAGTAAVSAATASQRATIMEPVVSSSAATAPLAAAGAQPMPSAGAPTQADRALEPPPPSPSKPAGGGRRNMIIGGAVVAFLALICVVAAAAVIGGNLLNQGDSSGETPAPPGSDGEIIAAGPAEATSTAEAGAAALTAEADASSLLTAEASDALLTAEAAGAFLTAEAAGVLLTAEAAGATMTAEAVEPAATEPLPTATSPPPPPPSPTVAAPTATSQPPPTATTAAGPSVRINSIALNGNSYVVDYTPFGYTPALPGTHIHFFFNTVPPEAAGVGPNQQTWFLYGGPNPFTGYGISDRPAGATQMCSLVANPDHTIQLNTGNCVDLPG